jgi:hypothetical protein
MSTSKLIQIGYAIPALARVAYVQTVSLGIHDDRLTEQMGHAFPLCMPTAIKSQLVASVHRLCITINPELPVQTHPPYLRLTADDERSPSIRVPVH